ncbi:hypothetical protein Q3G72_004927 [Acer saccharum]|nr:hypothetical protein Q3G72_004927 [Acer saccharum]
MAENEDLEQNQNVTENVNVPEAEKQPQNIEHASENEDLDQYLVYPRNTWAYDITITVHCKLKFIVDIRRVLEEEGELARFKRGCFGHYLDLPGHMQALFQAQYIHNLLLRQIRFPGASEDEMWLALGKNKVKLGKREFCLCSGLRFGVLPDIFLRDYVPMPDGIHIRYFGGQGGLLLEDVLSSSGQWRPSLRCGENWATGSLITDAPVLKIGNLSNGDQLCLKHGWRKRLTER